MNTCATFGLEAGGPPFPAAGGPPGAARRSAAASCLAALCLGLAGTSWGDEARGRYQLLFNPAAAGDVYLLDTQTGRVWQLAHNERESEPWFVERIVQKDDNPRFIEHRREAQRKLMRDRIMDTEFHALLLKAMESYAGGKGWALDWDGAIYPVGPTFRTPQGEAIDPKEYERDVRAEVERLAKEHPAQYADWSAANKEYRAIGGRPPASAPGEQPAPPVR